MHRLVSPFILNKDAAGETSGAFDAVGLFIDISGFSAITDALMQHGQLLAGTERLLAGIFKRRREYPRVDESGRDRPADRRELPRHCHERHVFTGRFYRRLGRGREKLYLRLTVFGVSDYVT